MRGIVARRYFIASQKTTQSYKTWAQIQSQKMQTGLATLINSNMYVQDFTKNSPKRIKRQYSTIFYSIKTR